MQDQTIIKDAINEGIGEIFYLLPIPFIILVIGISIWWGIIRFDGTAHKYYRVFNIVFALGLAALAHFTIPLDEELKIRDIPTLIISVIGSGVFVELFIYWRKRKK